MSYTIEQLDFLGAHIGVVIPPDFIENKKRQKEFQTLRSKFDSEHPDLNAFYAADRIRGALTRADEFARTGKDFASALKELAHAEELLKVPPPLPRDTQELSEPIVQPPENKPEKKPDEPRQPLPRDAQELSEPIVQPPEKKPDEPPPDTDALKKALAEAEKAVEDSLAALKKFDERIAAARDKVKPVTALKSSHPNVGIDADEKRMNDLIARAVKANSEQPAILKQLQAEVASGNDTLTKNDANALKALAGNVANITKTAQASAKTVSAASRMLDNIDAGVKFVQKTAAEADKLVTRLNAINLDAVADMEARAALIPTIDASGADDEQKEILKQMVFVVAMPVEKIEKELAKCNGAKGKDAKKKNAKAAKAMIEKLRKTGKDSDARRAVLAQAHALVGDVFRIYRELRFFKGAISDSQKAAFEKIRALTNTEYTFAMQSSVEASDDAKEVKEPKKGKKIEKKEDLLTPDAKIKSKLVGVMGGGPVGLLAAIETAMRGGKVIMYEARGGDSGKELYNRLNTIKLDDGTVQRLKKVGVWNDVWAKMDQGAHAVPVGALETILLARAKSLSVKFSEGKTVTDAVRSKDGKTVTLTVDGEKKPVIVQLVVVAAGAGFAKGGDKVSMAEKFGFEVVKADAKDFAVTGAFDPTSADRGGAKENRPGWNYGFKAPEVSYVLSQLSEKEYNDLARDPVKLEAFIRQSAVNQGLGNRDLKRGPKGAEVKPAAFPIEVQQAQNMTSGTSGAVLVGDSAATPHPSTALGLNTGAREIDAISDLVSDGGNEDEAMAAYDWETNRNTNVMVAAAMATMVTNAASRCRKAALKLIQELDKLGTPLATTIKQKAVSARDNVVIPLETAANNDDGADHWKLSSTNIKLMREIEEKFAAVLELTKPGANLNDATAILDGIKAA
jgi:2-polyprenyl-6-methoxyphenol hydroxylase-like FAD-dependent oxidoreductase